MSRIKAGQLSEAGKLFDRYHIVLFAFSFRITLNRAKSEDLVQNIFYRVLKYHHTFNPVTGSFKSWLFSIARNTHADFYKQECKINAARENVSQSQKELIQEHESSKEDDFERLAVALSKLDPSDQELIYLSRFNYMKYAEIAQLKQMSVAAIKVRIHRAIKALKDFYFTQ